MKYGTMNTKESCHWHDVFVTGKVGKQTNNELAAIALCGWGNCMSGNKPPEKFGEAIVAIGKRLGITASYENLLSYYKKHNTMKIKLLSKILAIVATVAIAFGTGGIINESHMTKEYAQKPAMAIAELLKEVEADGWDRELECYELSATKYGYAVKLQDDYKTQRVRLVIDTPHGILTLSTMEYDSRLLYGKHPLELSVTDERITISLDGYAVATVERNLTLRLRLTESLPDEINSK